MAFTMLLFMWGMYEKKAWNYGILAVAVLTFGLCYAGLRQQTLVSDVQWMKAMIPHHSSAITHHSSAIMVSQSAHLKDPEAIKLAEEIIEAQEREIAQMKKMIYRLEQEE